MSGRVDRIDRVVQSFDVIGMTCPAFESLADAYVESWGATLYAVDPGGAVVLPGKGGPDDALDCRRVHALALQEAIRWGQPGFCLYPRGRLLWGVPVMCNDRLLGGVVAWVDESVAFSVHGGQGMNLRRAADFLQWRLQEQNWTNRALLQERQRRYESEKGRAEAIHDYKLSGGTDVRRMYLQDEPALLSAIRRGNTPAARGILNRLLIHILDAAGGRLDHTKSFFMELVVTLYRTAVEVGADPDAILGDNYARVVELAGIRTEEALAPWLHEVLDNILECIHEHSAKTDSLMAEAQAHIREHCGEPLSRNGVAQVMGLSGAHFSRVFRAHTGQTFTDAVNQARVDRACGLLRRTTRDLAAVAMECGFSDQSYFTKVFRQYIGSTPRRYRQDMAD